MSTPGPDTSPDDYRAVPSDAPRDAPPEGSSAPAGGTGFWNVVKSVAAAGIGVQSKANRERDFTHGKPVHFIVGGLIGTALFLLAVYAFVRVLLATT